MIHLTVAEGKYYFADVVTLTSEQSTNVDEKTLTLVQLEDLKNGYQTGRLIMSSGDYTKLLTAIEDQQAGINPSAAIMDVNVQTGTNYTLVLDDAGNCVEMNNAVANTLTIPPNSTVAYDVGTTILIRQMGEGQTTLVAGSGVTIRNPHGTLKLSKQYASVALHKRSTDEWCIEGNLSEF